MKLLDTRQIQMNKTEYDMFTFFHYFQQILVKKWMLAPNAFLTLVLAEMT